MARDLRYIAELARLELGSEEAMHLTADVDRILELVANLPEMGTVSEGTLAPRTQALRSDEPRPGLRREDFLAMVPASEDGGVLVPKVGEL